MDTTPFFQKIRTYHTISAAAEQAWSDILQFKKYSKGDQFIHIGQVPRRIAFVAQGLFSQNFINDDGSVVIKYFFAEQ